jgi:hypothetical protein
VACPLADDPAGELVAAQHALEGRVARDVNDAHGHRDLIVLRTRLTLAVPALGDVAEQSPDGHGETEPIGEHLRHLA